MQHTKYNDKNVQQNDSPPRNLEKSDFSVQIILQRSCKNCFSTTKKNCKKAAKKLRKKLQKKCTVCVFPLPENGQNVGGKPGVGGTLNRSQPTVGWGVMNHWARSTGFHSWLRRRRALNALAASTLLTNGARSSIVGWALPLGMDPRRARDFPTRPQQEPNPMPLNRLLLINVAILQHNYQMPQDT